jgi:AcrR family transcriptional regulator
VGAHTTNTKNRIRETAMDLFKGKGYDRTSINEICRVCGITKAAFYYHYISKAELVRGFYLDLDHENPDQVFDLLSQPTNVEKYWSFISPFLNYTIQHGPGLLSQLFKVNMDSDKETFFYRSDFSEKLCVKFIKAAQEKGEIINPGEPKHIYTSINYMIFGVSLFWCIKKGQFDIKKEIRKNFDIILGTNPVP